MSENNKLVKQFSNIYLNTNLSPGFYSVVSQICAFGCIECMKKPNKMRNIKCPYESNNYTCTILTPNSKNCI